MKTVVWVGPPDRPYAFARLAKACKPERDIDQVGAAKDLHWISRRSSGALFVVLVDHLAHQRSEVFAIDFLEVVEREIDRRDEVVKGPVGPDSKVMEYAANQELGALAWPLIAGAKVRSQQVAEEQGADHVVCVGTAIITERTRVGGEKP